MIVAAVTEPTPGIPVRILLGVRESPPSISSVKKILEDLKTGLRSSQNTLLIAVDIGKIRNCACFCQFPLEKYSDEDFSSLEQVSF